MSSLIIIKSSSNKLIGQLVALPISTNNKLLNATKALSLSKQRTVINCVSLLALAACLSINDLSY